MEDEFKPTEAWAKDVIEACNMLIEKRYLLSDEERKMNRVDCPFSNISIKHFGTSADACAWIVLTGFTCAGTDAMGKRPSRPKYQEYTNEENIGRLKGWIEMCEQIIKDKQTKAHGLLCDQFRNPMQDCNCGLEDSDE